MTGKQTSAQVFARADELEAMGLPATAKTHRIRAQYMADAERAGTVPDPAQGRERDRVSRADITRKLDALANDTEDPFARA